MKRFGNAAPLLTAVLLALPIACATGEREDRAGTETGSAPESTRTEGTQGTTTGSTSPHATLRTVTGTIQQVDTQGEGIVVLGREPGGDEKQWAFSVDAATRIDQQGQTVAIGALGQGDAVSVEFTERDGKVVVHRVTSTQGSAMPASGSGNN